jgi:hypothetical protein
MERIRFWMSNKSWHEDSFISFPLNKGMNCITICFNWGNNYHTILVLQFDWSWYRYSPFGNGFIIKCSTVFNSEGNISNSVTMFWLMSIHFLFVILVRSWKSKKHTLVVFHHMSNNISVTSFKAFISIVLESESHTIPSCSLHCVSYPKVKMIKS